MRHLHLDFETFSSTELKETGAYRYAFSPDCEILCAAMAFDQEEPVVWHPRMSDKEISTLDPYWDALEDPEVLVYAHNSMFEIAISQALMQKTWGIPFPDFSRWRCTMSMARRAALPASLDQLSEVLNLTHQKDKRGKKLIGMFSVMQKPDKPTKKNPVIPPERQVPYRIYPQDRPAEFAEFMAYCAQDVRAEQEVARKLAYFDEPINNANFTLDQVINARGVPVNLEALRHAQKIIEEETEIVSKQFRELVGFEVTQRDEILRWLAYRGHTFSDLKKDTIEEFLETHKDGLDPAVQALRMKQATSFAAVKKVQTMLDCAGPHDNRIRGMGQHHGATTGRWTDAIVQFQNMKRSTLKYSNGDNASEDAYKDICAGASREMLELFYGPPLDVISSCIRHFVQDA